MKITEAMRRRRGLMMIEEIASEAALMDPKKSAAVDAIYRIAHTIRALRCRNNHPRWIEPIDTAIRAERRRPGKEKKR